MDEDEGTGSTNGKTTDNLKPTGPVDSDSDDDAAVDDIFTNSENKNQLYATSLPISMPGQWYSSHRHQRDVTEETDMQVVSLGVYKSIQL